MSLAQLNEKDREVVRQCLLATVEGPFFPDWEFQTLFGLERAEIRSVLESWPELDDSHETVHLAINSSFGNLLGYPHRCESEWSRFISVSDKEVMRIFKLWQRDV
jgi:hypothetical protein